MILYNYPFKIGDEVIITKNIYEDGKLLFKSGDKCIVTQSEYDNYEHYPLVFDPRKKKAAFLLTGEYHLIKHRN